jgi:hypothetical protein
MMLIEHWRWEPGDRKNPNNQYLRGCRIESLPRGWYCQVRSVHDRHASWRVWLEKNCPSAEIDMRWNSGDPYYSVYIPDDQEAILFRLRWSR